VFMKKGWKGLVGHPYERRRCGIFFIFRTAFLFFYFCHFIFILFLIAINLLMFMLVRKDCC
jgi:hypothetical protein